MPYLFPLLCKYIDLPSILRVVGKLNLEFHLAASSVTIEGNGKLLNHYMQLGFQKVHSSNYALCMAFTPVKVSSEQEIQLCTCNDLFWKLMVLGCMQKGKANNVQSLLEVHFI